ncbi:hypothetical protein FGO68_gene14004 [Halteria grandinella]|uniref:Uncharacterized protein n=1 Tax=Halteria grandinella TaxID=5974 RepID=A0A8J8SW11_HALGN|nr:hypothetical protein FGO68_gene14004 [Halteria grandinella]
MSHHYNQQKHIPVSPSMNPPQYYGGGLPSQGMMQHNVLSSQSPKYPHHGPQYERDHNTLPSQAHLRQKYQDCSSSANPYQYDGYQEPSQQRFNSSPMIAERSFMTPV